MDDDNKEESFGLKTNDRQAAEIRQDFGTTVSQYLMPVEEIVEQILSGEGDKESASVLTGLLNTLLDASFRMGFDEVHSLMSEFAEAVDELKLDIRKLRNVVIEYCAEIETLYLSKEVGGFADRLGRIKRSVARGSNETIAAN